MGPEDAVELGLGRLARTVAVVQVDDGPGQQPLGVDRLQGAIGQRVGDLGDAIGVPAGGEGEVARHQLVGQRQELAELLARGLRDAHEVAERLRHLVDAVEALEQRRGEHALPLLALLFLEGAAHEVVEQLVGAAELDVGLAP